jgi:preprotein translocase subunit SecE
MSKKIPKARVTEKDVGSETEVSGASSRDLSPQRSARVSRLGSAGDGGGGHERRLVAGAGLLGRVAQFLRDVRAEMKRVSWPTANEVKNTTVITLVAVIFFAVYLFLVDRVWAFLLLQLNHLLNWLTGA